MSLPTLISEYNTNHRSYIENRRSRLSRATYDEVINERTPHTKTNGWYFRTQKLGSSDTTFEREITNALLSNNDLRNGRLRTFAQIFWAVQMEAVRTTLKGYRQMTIYDISQYIGEHFGIYPDDVYVHRGVRNGAFALGLTPNETDDFILPLVVVLRTCPELVDLGDAAHIENFLCHYADKLEELFNIAQQ